MIVGGAASAGQTHIARSLALITTDSFKMEGGN